MELKCFYLLSLAASWQVFKVYPAWISGELEVQQFVISQKSYSKYFVREILGTALLFATVWQVVSFPDLQMQTQRSGQSLNGWQESTNFRSFQMETNSELGHFHFRFLKTMWNSTKRAIICNNLTSFKSKLSNLHIFQKTNEIISINYLIRLLT